MKLINRYFLPSLYIITAFCMGFTLMGYWASKGFVKPSFKSLTNLASLPRAFVVLSGSMEPTIKTGSVVFDLPSTFYNSGDIVTFKSPSDSKTLVTHRIGNVSYPNGILGAPEFMTIGDTNKNFDSAKFGPKNIVGKVFFTIPYLGYLIDFSKQPYGFILLVIVPGTIFIYEELKSLFAELSKNIKTLWAKRKKVEESVELEIASEVKGLHKGFIIFPILGAFLVGIGLTGSYFLNVATSTNNNFSASANFSTPTPTPTTAPTHIVLNELFLHDKSKQEWVEIYNGTASSVSVNEWTITDNNGSDTLPNVSIPSGGFGVIVTSDTVVAVPAPAITITLANKTIGGNDLDLAGDRLILKNSSAIEVDKVSYGTDTSVFTMTAPASSNASYRHPNGQDTDTSTDWQVGTGTLGVINP